MPLETNSETVGPGACGRVWLGWDGPLLPAAAEWLLQRAGDAPTGPLEMAAWTLTVPGRRAGRRLLAALARGAADRGRALVPPRILTPGTLGPALLPARMPIASPLERHLAWTAALRSLEPDALAAVTPLPLDSTRDRTDGTDEAAWDLARMLDGAWAEVAGADVEVESIPDAADDLLLHRDADRWRAIEGLIEAYRRILRKARREDPVAWVERIDELTPASPLDAPIVLVGVLELSGAQRRLLERAGDRVHVLVGAPPDVAGDIDRLGCPIPAAWTTPRTLAPRDALIRGDGPHDQAQVVLEHLAQGPDLDGAITIGVADERLLGPLTRAAGWAGLTLHSGAGWPVRRTGPWRLLEAIAGWIDTRDADHLGRLLRHPDLEAWIGRRRRESGERQRHWLPALDRLRRSNLTDSFPQGWRAPDDESEPVARVVGWLDELLAGLAEAGPLGAWVEPIMDVLRAVYDPPPSGLLETDRLAEALSMLRETTEGLRTIPGALRDRVPGTVAIRLLLEETRGAAVAIEPAPGATEMLGWLELLHDDALRLVIAGMNEGAVPADTSGDPLLPDALRARVGLPGAEQRLARDAFVLENLLRSRDGVKLVCGRRDVDAEPLAPSRLLLGGSDTELATRVLDIVEGEAIRRATPMGLAAPSDETGFRVPRAPRATPGAPAGTPIVDIARLPVTAFRDYLQCPYRFWLKHVERLRAVEEEALELDALAFGSLAHDVLDVFGRGEAAHSNDPRVIEAFLVSALNRIATDRFGAAPLSAVRIQLRRLERRFAAFARVQARHRAAGWRVEAVEIALPETTSLLVPGQAPVRVTGRIDRVDRHEEDGTLLIIDYKTGDTPRTPEKTHRATEGDDVTWVDLQLPLYEHLRDRVRFDGPAKVAYGLLPSRPADSTIAIADWDEDVMATAVDAARTVVRDIRAGIFGPMADRAPVIDPYARICQSSVLGRLDPVLAGAEADE